MIAKTLKLNKFEQSLVEMDDRINVYDGLFGDHGIKGLDDYGYIPRKNEIFITGVFPTLSHEIAHIVEINDKNRLLKDDFGMSVLFAEKLFKSNAKYSFAAFARETRVEAIQSVIDNSEKNTFERLTSNPIWNGAVKSNVPFGKFNNFKQVEEWVSDIFFKDEMCLVSRKSKIRVG